MQLKPGKEISPQEMEGYNAGNTRTIPDRYTQASSTGPKSRVYSGIFAQAGLIHLKGLRLFRPTSVVPYTPTLSSGRSLYDCRHDFGHTLPIVFTTRLVILCIVVPLAFPTLFGTSRVLRLDWAILLRLFGRRIVVQMVTV